MSKEIAIVHHADRRRDVVMPYALIRHGPDSWHTQTHRENAEVELKESALHRTSENLIWARQCGAWVRLSMSSFLYRFTTTQRALTNW
jgi:hypothetical protein